MKRIFIKSQEIQNNVLSITGDYFHYLTRVMRLGVGDQFLAIDELYQENIATITKLNKTSLAASLAGDTHLVTAISPRLSGQVVIAQAYIKQDKLELLLQKGTELGVSEFQFYPAHRSVVKIASDESKKKITRWSKIVTDASRQSERLFTPEIKCLASIDELILHFGTFDLVIFCNEQEEQYGLREALAEYQPGKKVLCLVGPEGGFTSEEAITLIKAGAQSVSLGKLILRAETVGIYLASVIHYLYE